MGWRQKLMSRKFAVAVASFVAAVAKIIWDVDVDASVLVGLSGVLIAYLAGQSWVDKETVAGQADIMKNEALLQAQAYVKYLEQQLSALSGDDAVSDG